MKHLLILGVVLCFAYSSKAQTNGPILNYTFNEVAVNPAYIGTYDGFSAGLNARKQALGIEGSPSAQRLNLALPLVGTKSSVGLLFNNSSFGVTSQVDITAQYSYKLLLSKGALYFGLQGGLESLKENNDELLLKDPEMGALFANNERAVAFNTGFGVYYSTDRYYVGLSAPKFYYNSFKDGEVNAQLFDKNMFRTYLTAGYTFPVGNAMNFRPSTLICYQMNGAVNAEAALTGLFIDNTFWVGVAYRTNREMGLNIGLKLQKMIDFNYSFGAGVGRLSQQAGTMHELGLKFSIPSKKNQGSGLN